MSMKFTVLRKVICRIPALIFSVYSLTRPQLLAVTDNVNQQKSDQDLAEWLPSRTEFHCVYVRAWVQVKYYYGLNMDSAEKAVAQDILSGC